MRTIHSFGGRPGDDLEIGSQGWVDAVYEKPPLVLGLSSFYMRYDRSQPFAMYGDISGYTNVANYVDWIAERVPDAMLVGESYWNTPDPGEGVPMPTPLSSTLVMTVSALMLFFLTAHRRKGLSISIVTETQA